MKQDFVIETDTRRLVWQRAGESDSVRFKPKTLRSAQRSRRLHISSFVNLDDFRSIQSNPKSKIAQKPDILNRTMKGVYLTMHESYHIKRK